MLLVHATGVLLLRLLLLLLLWLLAFGSTLLVETFAELAVVPFAMWSILAFARLLATKVVLHWLKLPAICQAASLVVEETTVIALDVLHWLLHATMLMLLHWVDIVKAMLLQLLLLPLLHR